MSLLSNVIPGSKSTFYYSFYGVENRGQTTFFCTITPQIFPVMVFSDPGICRTFSRFSFAMTLFYRILRTVYFYLTSVIPELVKNIVTFAFNCRYINKMDQGWTIPGTVGGQCPPKTIFVQKIGSFFIPFTMSVFISAPNYIR